MRPTPAPRLFSAVRRARKGAAVVEYIILLALIGGLAIISALSFGATTRDAYAGADTALRANIPPATPGGGSSTTPTTTPTTTPPATPPATPPTTPPATPPAPPAPVSYAIESWSAVMSWDPSEPDRFGLILSIGQDDPGDAFANTVAVMRYTFDPMGEVGARTPIAFAPEVGTSFYLDAYVLSGGDAGDVPPQNASDIFFTLAPFDLATGPLAAPHYFWFDSSAVRPAYDRMETAQYEWEQATDALGAPAYGFDLADLYPEYVAELCQWLRPVSSDASETGTVAGRFYNHGALAGAPAGRVQWALACTSSSDPATRAAALASTAPQIGAYHP